MYKTQNGWTKEKMIAHIETEFKGRSVKPGTLNDCLYRGPNGKKCAVGMFIPNELYNIDMDGPQNSAHCVIRGFNLNGVMPLDEDGMDSFQRAHDHVSIGADEEVLMDLINFIEAEVTD